MAHLKSQTRQSLPSACESTVLPFNENAIMFTLSYATLYIFQSLKLMTFQLERSHLQITILLLQMNSSPWWGEKSTSIKSRGMISRSLLLISYYLATHVHECTQARRLSLHSWLNTWMSDSFNERDNNRERGEHLGRLWGAVWTSLCGQSDTILFIYLSLSPAANIFARMGNGDCIARI